MKDKGHVYDAVYSLGQWCATAMCMRKLGLRQCSGPFDWFAHGLDVRQYADMIADGMHSLMLKENLRRSGANEAEGALHYRDEATGLESRHDFKIGIPFDENYAGFRARLDRRIARLLATLRSGRRVLFVHWRGEGRCSRDEVVGAVRRLRGAFPESSVDLLVIETEKFAKGVAYENPEPGVVFAVGDFYDQSRFDPVLGNESLALSVLRRIRIRGRWKNLLRLRLDSFRRRLRRHRRAKR